MSLLKNKKTALKKRLWGHFVIIEVFWRDKLILFGWQAAEQ